MKVYEEESKIRVILSKTMLTIDEDTIDKLEPLFNKLKTLYNLKLENAYFVKIYENEFYGYIIDIFLNEEDELYFDDFDINVQFIKSPFLFKVDEDYYEMYKNKLNFKRGEEITLILDRELSNIEYGILLEHTYSLDITS